MGEACEEETFFFVRLGRAGEREKEDEMELGFVGPWFHGSPICGPNFNFFRTTTTCLNAPLLGHVTLFVFDDFFIFYDFPKINSRMKLFQN
jgi:hypothetical protein